MSRKSAYVGWFGRLNLPEANTDETETVELEDLNYEDGRISFKLVRYITRNVPTRYTTVNYVRHPVAWKKSIRSAVVFKVNKSISLERYCEIELKNTDIPQEFKNEILDYLNYFPTWKQKEMDIESKEEEICELEKTIKKKIDIEHELKKVDTEYDQKIRNVNIERANLKIVKSSILSIILRVIFTIPTLGLSWLGYVSEFTAQYNKKAYDLLGDKNKNIELEKHKAMFELNKKLEKENKDIDKFNRKINSEIEIERHNLQQICDSDYTATIIEDQFEDLRKKIICVEKFDCKGVYIIWNKTKNKYYVGQSKDVYKRLFTQHFRNGDVNNVIFVRDWDANDEFYFKIIELETKDQLDVTEKEYIEKYDSFKSGYNNTGGNR